MSEPYLTTSDVIVASVFYLFPNSDNRAVVSHGWYVKYFEPDPDPPRDLWAEYVAATLTGEIK